LDFSQWYETQNAGIKREYQNALEESRRFAPGNARALHASDACLSLITLENRIGPEKMNEILKTFASRYPFQEPGLDEFLSVVLEEAGREASDLAAALLREGRVVDYAVERAVCRPATKPEGYVPQSGIKESIEENFTPPEKTGGRACPLSGWKELIRFGPRISNDGPMDGDAPETGETPAHTAYTWDVVVSNRGDVALPVTVQLIFEGGKTEKKEWDGNTGSIRFTGKAPERLLFAVVDPEAVYAVDLNRLNNQRAVEFNHRGVLFLAGWVQFWIQNYLNGWAFLN
jgi:hypothetical protein